MIYPGMPIRALSMAVKEYVLVDATLDGTMVQAIYLYRVEDSRRLEL